MRCTQVRRLSWHPSVAVWAGNNEIEGSFNWYSETRSNKQLFTGDYIALFIDTIKNIIRAVRPTRALGSMRNAHGSARACLHARAAAAMSSHAKHAR